MADVFQALKTNTAEIEVAKQKIIDINETISQSFKELEQAEAEGTVIGPRGVPTTVDAEKQQMAAALSEQTANQRRAETIDFEDYSNELMSQIKEHKAAQAQKLQEIADINSSSNPLVHIAGLVMAPFKAVQAESHQALADAKTDELAKANAMMQTSARTSAEIQTRVTEDTNASMAAALAKDQAVVALKARITAQQTNSANISQVLALSKEQLNNRIQAFNIEEAMDMRNLRKAQIQQMMDMRAQANDDKEAARASLDFINQSLIANGKDPIPPAMETTVLQQINRPGAVGEMLRDLFTDGVKGVLTGGQFQQGTTPVEAAQFREKIGFIPTTETERDTLAAVEDIMSNSQAVREATTRDARLQAMNDSVKQFLEANQTNVTTDKASLTKPVSWATMSASEVFRNNKLYKEIISPQITDNVSMNAVEPSDIFKRVSTAVKAKQASIQEAAELLQQYAQLSIEMNNQVTGLPKLTGYSQSKFMAKLPQPRVRSDLFTLTGFRDNKIDYLYGNTAVNKVKEMLPYKSETVDFLNLVKIQEALAAHLSGELREPAK